MLPAILFDCKVGLAIHFKWKYSVDLLPSISPTSNYSNKPDGNSIRLLCLFLDVQYSYMITQ